MTTREKVKSIFMHCGIGLSFPAVFLVNAFLVPEPYSHPLIYVSIAPTNLMPFLENRELMGEFTVALFGRMTPNYAPITIVFLIIFWFIVGVVGSLALFKFKVRNNASQEAHFNPLL
jgi:hypothetical protein